MAERLTKRLVDAAQPAAKDVFIWDTEVRGLGLKVTPKGEKIYVFQGRVRGAGTVIGEDGKEKRANPVRVTIGRHGDFTPDTARKEAEDIRKGIRKGADPREEKQRAIDEVRCRQQEEERLKARAFSAVAEAYLAELVRGRQKKASEVEAVIERRFVSEWGERDIGEISRRDVREVLKKMVAAGQGGAARKALAVVRPLFAYAVRDELITANPASGQKVEEKYVPRARVLSDEELREVWKAAEVAGEPFGPMVKLLILTGQRLREVAHAEWREFDQDGGIWVIPGTRTKNKKEHLVHLSKTALSVFCDISQRDQCPFLFTTTGKTPVSGFSKAKARFDALIVKARERAAAEMDVDALPMPEWDFHDLRRTVATGAARLGIAPHIIEKVLNHNPAALKGVAGIYNRFEYLPERKVAIEAWDRHVAAVVAGKATGSNVVELRKSG